MLVKELRQGLRSNLFVGVFILSQATMLVITTLRLNPEAEGRDVDFWLWLALSSLLLFILPARGLTAVSDEQQANTLDLVKLTRLGSFTIVAQKWMALVCQALLFVIAVLPYMALRYFFGGVDVVRELMQIAWLYLFLLPLTAFGLALSPVHRAMRTLMFLLPCGCSVAFATTSFDPSDSFRLDQVFAMLFFSVLGSVFCLSTAAARIASPDENASAKMRVIAFAMVFLSCLRGYHSYGGVPPLKLGEWTLLALPIMFWASSEAMVEQTWECPAMYFAWVRRGWWGRMAGRLLYPGWATGLVFAGVLILCLWLNLGLRYWLAGALPAKSWAAMDSNVWPAIIGVGHLGMIMIFPAVALSCLPQLRQRWLVWFGVHACSFVFWLLGSEMVPYPSLEPVLYAFTPFSAFLWSEFDGDRSHYRYLAALVSGMMIDSCILMFLFSRARVEFRKIRQMEQQASLLLHAE